METAADTVQKRFRLGRLDVDLEGYQAWFAGRALALSPTQLELLAALVVNCDRVSSRAELSRSLGLVRERSVDVMLCALRKELGRDFVRNVRNRGWVVDREALTS